MWSGVVFKINAGEITSFSGFDFGSQYISIAAIFWGVFESCAVCMYNVHITDVQRHIS